MTRSITLALLAAATLAALPRAARAQDTRPGMAVLPFENGGSYGQEKENFEALQVGIPAILMDELARNPAVRLVDRSQIQQLLGEQDLGAKGRVDAGTAAKIGKLVGARYMIMGSFVDFYGKFRLNARIVDVQTGEILKAVSDVQDRNALYRIIQRVAQQVMADVNLPPLPADAAGASKARSVPTEALTLYSRALLYQDRGDKAKAVEFYRKALDVYPAYTEASEGLRKAGAS